MRKAPSTGLQGASASLADGAHEAVGAVLLACILSSYTATVARSPGKPQNFLDTYKRGPLHVPEGAYDNCSWCKACSYFKPMEAHHCGTCDMCVQGMDHHCVWMANCIGTGNLRDFVLFLSWMLPFVHLTLPPRLVMAFSVLVLSAGANVGMAVMLMAQLRLIWRGTSYLESLKLRPSPAPAASGWQNLLPALTFDHKNHEQRCHFETVKEHSER
eukprot:jgi/Astpho2/6631/Aster-x1386